MYLLVVFSTLSSKYSHFMELSEILRTSMQCLEQKNTKFHMPMKKIIYSKLAFVKMLRRFNICKTITNKSQIDTAKSQVNISIAEEESFVKKIQDAEVKN